MADGHWVDWHAAYENPDSSLSRRLAVVQRRLADALDTADDGPIQLISLCAGQGRDVISVLRDHPRRADVTARLVELDSTLVANARVMAADAGLHQVEIVEGDASSTSAYQGMIPADVILACGIFGNISADDIQATISELPRLSAPGATVIWTRHRRPPDLTPTIRAWFRDAGFEEVAFDGSGEMAFGVGTNRFVGTSLAYRPRRRLFTFVGNGVDASY